jgi:pimeloyl-ACP methyl ester carboxylesterase
MRLLCGEPRFEHSVHHSSRTADTVPLIHTNGIDLYHEEAGDGPPLLLISGAGGTTLDWMPLLPALTERFRVVFGSTRPVHDSADGR